MADIPLLVPTDNAGEFLIPALGEKVKLIKWKEDDYFDTVYRVAGAITAGTKLKFFTDTVTSKGAHQTNLSTQRRINAGSKMVMNRLGLLICQSTGNTLAVGDDINKFSYSASLLFKIGKERIVAEGPAVKFPSGYGLTGSTTAFDRSYVTIGVPSVAAAPTLLVAQPILDNDDLYADLSFEDPTGLAAAIVMPTTVAQITVTLFLHGLIQDPQGK